MMFLGSLTSYLDPLNLNLFKILYPDSHVRFRQSLVFRFFLVHYACFIKTITMSFLRFYDGAVPGKKRKTEETNGARKKKIESWRAYEEIRSESDSEAVELDESSVEQDIQDETIDTKYHKQCIW
jgi:hypothetical protein